MLKRLGALASAKLVCLIILNLKCISAQTEAQCKRIPEFAPIKAQIQSMKGQVTQIVDYVLNGPSKHQTYDELAIFCDTFGPRMSGSKSLESAIDYMRDKMVKSGLKVTEDEVMVPNWELVSQSCEISAPVQHTMNILTLGDSVSTQGTLEAEVVVVPDFEALKVRGQRGEVKGKIVVFNYMYTKYDECVKYRDQGALLAAEYGASAALVRSLTPLSINRAHSGRGSKSIPTAAITVEDANLIERWVKRNKTVKIKLNIQTKHNADSKSRNLIGDIVGSSKPGDIVFASGHTDTWYNSVGAMDDGGGMMASYMALDVLKKLNLQGKRTIRTILWTASEPGNKGAEQYFDKNADKKDSFKMAIESNRGTFEPLGWSHQSVGGTGLCVLKEILNVASDRVSMRYVIDRFEAADIRVFADNSVPGSTLVNKNSRYFEFHGTSGDTIDVQDPNALDKNTALIAATLYVLSNLDNDMRL